MELIGFKTQTFIIECHKGSFFEGSGIWYIIHLVFQRVFGWGDRAKLKPEFVVPIHDLADLYDLHRRSVKHTQKYDDNIEYATPWGSGSSWNQHSLQLLSANQASYPN